MLIAGVYCPKIRIPKDLRTREVAMWPSLRDPKARALILKLAVTAAKRWSLAMPDTHGPWYESEHGEQRQIHRENALTVLERADFAIKYATDPIEEIGTTIAVAWAEEERLFQLRMPEDADAIELAKREWSR